MFDVLFLAEAEANPQQLQGVETESQVSVDGSPEVKTGDKDLPPQNPWASFAPLLIMLGLLYFFMMRGPQKKEKARKQMLSDMKKNDKVRTIGGIIGTVVEVREKEIIVKIDESNNTRIKMVREGIGEVLAD